jgi:hypothetical protein
MKMQAAKKKYFLATLSIAKNESMVIDEFVRHYEAEGVQHMYIIDNGSTDSMASVLKPYIDKGFVTYFYFDKQYAQVEHYNTVYNEVARWESEWLAVVDVDEYLYSPKRQLLDYVRTIDPTSNVYVKWSMFNSSGFDRQPSNIRASFVNRSPTLHVNGKSIVNTEITHKLDMHMSPPIKDADPTQIHLNHYATMSWEYFSTVKMTRGDASTLENVRDRAYFESYDATNQGVVDEELAIKYA